MQRYPHRRWQFDHCARCLTAILHWFAIPRLFMFLLQSYSPNLQYSKRKIASFAKGECCKATSQKDHHGYRLEVGFRGLITITVNDDDWEFPVTIARSEMSPSRLTMTVAQKTDTIQSPHARAMRSDVFTPHSPPRSLDHRQTSKLILTTPAGLIS